MPLLTWHLGQYLKIASTLMRGGATLSSVVLYPLRARMLGSKRQIDLRNGLSITAPADEWLWWLFQEVWVNATYKPLGFSFAPGQVIVDIGAHVGVFTLWAATACPEARVFAVEPTPATFEFLRRNIEANRLQNVELLQCACGGADGHATLYARGAPSMNTLYTRDLLGSSFRPLVQTPVVALDTLFSRFGVSHCDFLKLDCEGAEYEILLCAKPETLRSIGRIALEYHVGLAGNQPRELVDFLRGHGFDVEVRPSSLPYVGILFAASQTLDGS